MSQLRRSTSVLPLTDELSAVSARMAGLVLSEETVDTGLGVLGSLARETVPGSSGAGVSILDGQRRRSSGSTDVLVQRADDLQYELDEGPCLDAAASRELVRVDDLTVDRRWPAWAGSVTPLGLRAAMSAPLVAGDESLGAIKVYADRPDVFDRRSEQLLVLFSAQAAILVADLRTRERGGRMSEDLRRAVAGRDAINLAKGVLMGRHGIDEEAALGMLVARSHDEGATLAQVARAILDSAVRRGR